MNYPLAIKEKPLSQQMFSPDSPVGYKYWKVEEDFVFIPENKEYNHILFLLEGKLKMSCNDFINRPVHSREFVFIPIAADVACRVLESSYILLFTFDNLLAFFGKDYTDQLLNLCKGTKQTFPQLSFCESIDHFAHHLSSYIEQEINGPLLMTVKQMELVTLLNGL